MAFDIDDDELRATREKTADEMFKELGYEIAEEVSEKTDKYGCGIQLKKEMLFKTKYIEFYYYHKTICIIEDHYMDYVDGKIASCKGFSLNMQELQAINKKCKEMGWLK